MKKLKKLLVHLYAGLICDQKKRKALRSLFLQNPEDFVFVVGFYSLDGVSWGEYVLSHNMPEVIKNLRRGLDDKSNQLLDIIFSRMTILPKGLESEYQTRVACMQTPLFQTPQEAEYRERYYKERPQYIKDYILDLPSDQYTVETFTYHNGLRNKSKKLKQYIAGKDFIDGGAFIGDTALLYIKEYNPRCVYSFEISAKTCVRYEKTMKMNKIAADKYKLVPIGLSDKKSEIMIIDSAHTGTTILLEGNDKVQLTDLDSFVLENNLKVGFIKVDIEGTGFEAFRHVRNHKTRSPRSFSFDLS